VLQPSSARAETKESLSWQGFCSDSFPKENQRTSAEVIQCPAENTDLHRGLRSEKFGSEPTDCPREMPDPQQIRTMRSSQQLAAQRAKIIQPEASQESDATLGATESVAPRANSKPPAETFEIEVKKDTEGSKVGLEFDWSEGSELKVLKVKEGGLIDDYNKLAAAEGRMEMKAGDHIVEVNGIPGSREAVRQAARSRLLKIKFRTTGYDRRKAAVGFSTLDWS